MFKPFIVTAAFLGALSVMLGAFGAHALKEWLTPLALNTYETAVRYQFYHVFALAFSGILYKDFPYQRLITAGKFFVAGIILFSGSLYLLTFFSVKNITGFQWIGAITPIGGGLFIIGWIFLGMGVLSSKSK